MRERARQARRGGGGGRDRTSLPKGLGSATERRNENNPHNLGKEAKPVVDASAAVAAAAAPVQTRQNTKSVWSRIVFFFLFWVQIEGEKRYKERTRQRERERGIQGEKEGGGVGIGRGKRGDFDAAVQQRRPLAVNCQLNSFCFGLLLSLSLSPLVSLSFSFSFRAQCLHVAWAVCRLN